MQGNLCRFLFGRCIGCVMSCLYSTIPFNPCLVQLVRYASSFFVQPTLRERAACVANLTSCTEQRIVERTSQT